MMWVAFARVKAQHLALKAKYEPRPQFDLTFLHSSRAAFHLALLCFVVWDDGGKYPEHMCMISRVSSVLRGGKPARPRVTNTRSSAPWKTNVIRLTVTRCCGV